MQSAHKFTSKYCERKKPISESNPNITNTIEVSILSIINLTKNVNVTKTRFSTIIDNWNYVLIIFMNTLICH